MDECQYGASWLRHFASLYQCLVRAVHTILYNRSCVHCLADPFHCVNVQLQYISQCFSNLFNIKQVRLNATPSNVWIRHCSIHTSEHVILTSDVEHFFTRWLFVPSFIKIPPVSKEVPRHTSGINGRTDSRTAYQKTQCLCRLVLAAEAKKLYQP